MTLPDEVRSLFDGANYAHLATLLPGGAPVSTPIWAGIEDGRLVFFTQRESRKAGHLERDPRVALSLVDYENPYRSARVRGRIAETFDGDEALAIIDRIAHKYTGQPFPLRSGTADVVDGERAGFGELPFRHEPERDS